MGYGKCWKVPKEKVEELANNADSNEDCFIEVWHDTSDKIEDCELYIKLPTTWTNDWPIDDPPSNPT